MMEHSKNIQMTSFLRAYMHIWATKGMNIAYWRNSPTIGRIDTLLDVII